MKIPRHSGFTILEVLLVLVIVTAILAIIFLAIPGLQRNSRNVRRDADAQRIVNAIDECLINNNRDQVFCSDPKNVPIKASDLSIFTGFHYGSTVTVGSGTSVPPTPDEPNYLFGLHCNASMTWFSAIGDVRTFVVTYYREQNGGLGSRCLDENT